MLRKGKDTMSKINGEQDLDRCQVTHHHQLEYLKNRMPSQQEMEAAAELFKVFGDPTRLKLLAALLGLEFTANGAKPLTFGVNRAVKAMGAAKSETLVVGDQIFTDVMAGNLAGIRTVLVEPFHLEKTWTFRLKRRVESVVFHRDYSKLEEK